VYVDDRTISLFAVTKKSKRAIQFASVTEKPACPRPKTLISTDFSVQKRKKDRKSGELRKRDKK
jgi:hypothetical protein